MCPQSSLSKPPHLQSTLSHGERLPANILHAGRWAKQPPLQGSLHVAQKVCYSIMLYMTPSLHLENSASQQAYHHPPWCPCPLLLQISVAWLQVQTPQTLPDCCQIAGIVALWHWLHPRAERHPADLRPGQPAHKGPDIKVGSKMSSGSTAQRSQSWHGWQGYASIAEQPGAEERGEHLLRLWSCMGRYTASCQPTEDTGWADLLAHGDTRIWAGWLRPVQAWPC